VDIVPGGNVLVYAPGFVVASSLSRQQRASRWRLRHNSRAGETNFMATRATSNDHLQQAHGEHGGKVLYLYWYILVPLTHLLMHTVPRTRTRTVRHSRRGPPSTPVGDLFTKCNAAILRLSFVGPTDRLRRGPRGRAGGSAGRRVGPWRRVSVRGGEYRSVAGARCGRCSVRGRSAAGRGGAV
jgi:hypothetical protein